jgi:hypothetical protein
MLLLNNVNVYYITNIITKWQKPCYILMYHFAKPSSFSVQDIIVVPFLFLVVLRFELRALHLLGKLSNT